jgi:hypothetical protein
MSAFSHQTNNKSSGVIKSNEEVETNIRTDFFSVCDFEYYSLRRRFK